MTPLHVAAENAHIHVVKYFVEEGADINIRDHQGVNNYFILMLIAEYY